jgi:beta-lactam-binding protein with PASTA domain
MRFLGVLLACVLVAVVVAATGCASDGAPAAQQEQATPDVEVPSIVGLSESGARSVLEREGLTVGDITSEKVAEAGGQPTVLRQTPAPGETTKAGEPVSFVVSMPSVKMIEIPDVATSGTRV